MDDYSKLSAQEKMDLYLKQKTLAPEEYDKIEKEIFAKKIIPESSAMPEKQTEPKRITPFKDKNYLNTKNEITNEIENLSISPQDKEYLKRMAYKESRYNVNIENPYHYFGLYQMGKDYLTQFGKTKADIKDNSMLQHELALKGANFNTKGLEKYYGTTFNGIKLNKWNLAAAAHLGGRGTLNKWLRGDIKDFADANGTTIVSRLKEFEDIG